MELIIIAAMSENRVIGKDGKIPWHISDDLRRFKKITTGHAVMMGRKTFESLGRPLSDRKNLVISASQHAAGKSNSSMQWFSSPDSALEKFQHEERIFIIGGGTLYSYFLMSANALFLTIVRGTFEGDAYFPAYEHLVGSHFSLISEENHDGYRFCDFTKIYRR